MQGRTFLPEWSQFFDGISFRGTYRLFREESFRTIPGNHRFASDFEALKAAKAYVLKRLNPEIRAQRSPSNPDPLGIAHWHDNRAGRAANDQVMAFGAIFVKGKRVEVETKRRRA